MWGQGTKNREVFIGIRVGRRQEAKGGARLELLQAPLQSEITKLRSLAEQEGSGGR